MQRLVQSTHPLGKVMGGPAACQQARRRSADGCADLVHEDVESMAAELSQWKRALAEETARLNREQKWAWRRALGVPA